MTTSLTDIHSDIIQTHILPCLDGPSLATTATLSSYLQNLCSDDNLWYRICKSTWPSTTDHPRVHEIISTFPYGHRSFFHDAFPALVTNRSRCKKDQQLDCLTSYPGLSELVSAIDIHYQNDIIYSTVELTDTSTKDFLSSALWIELKNDQSIIKRSIDLKVDEIGEATLLHLKESLTLNWVVMGMTWKRAGNLSSVKPVSVKEDLLTNEILVKYITILPGRDPKELVQCRIHVVLEGEVAAGLQVKMVILKLQNLNSICLNGNDFLVIIQRAIMEENRKMVANNDQEIMISCKEFKEMKREKRKEKENRKQDVAVENNYTDIFVLFFICVYFLLVLFLQSPGLGLG